MLCLDLVDAFDELLHKRNRERSCEQDNRRGEAMQTCNAHALCADEAVSACTPCSVSKWYWSAEFMCISHECCPNSIVRISE